MVRRDRRQSAVVVAECRREGCGRPRILPSGSVTLLCPSCLAALLKQAFGIAA